MKKLVLGLALAFSANAAMAADPVKYLDWDSTTSNLVERTCSAYELVTADTTAFEDAKWYVVADTVVIDNGDNITVNGSAHLILCDNASLTIKSVANSAAAIDVSVSGSTTNSLAIYGQQGGSGLLTATGGQFGAGIGTAERSETAEGSGVIVINGGSLTATGGDWGAGIGGGHKGAGGTVTVNGGTVTATGGQNGAGIGGGNQGAGGVVTVNGGSLTATSGQNGAGIGGGMQGAGGTVTVNGGVVTATGGMNGAGIGGGKNGAGGTVTINGGTVTAAGGNSGAGIGGGMEGVGGTVTINGGMVTATGGSFGGAGIGGGFQGAGGTVTFGAGAWLVLAGDSAPGKEVLAADYVNNHSARYVCIKPSLSLKIPAGVHYSYVVSNETTGAELKGVLADGTNTYSVKNGSTVKVYFTPEERYELDKTEYAFAKPIDEDCSIPAEDMPTATYLYAVITVGQLNHMTAAWTSGDGTVTNAIEGMSFEVLKGTTGVKVIFTPDQNYRFVNGGETGVRELDSPLAEGCEVTPPETEGIPGTVVNPWVVGTDVRAYMGDEGTLVITGTGAMDDFASAADVSWAAVADQVTAVTVADGVTLGKNALALLSNDVLVTFGSPVLSVGTMKGATGVYEPPAPVIPDDKVLVSKESIAAAKAMTVQVVNGQIELSVSVSTNADITAEVPWAPVKFTPDTQIGLSSDGTKLILPIPVAAQQGFMILQSGDAKAVPSNGAKQGFYKLEAR